MRNSSTEETADEGGNPPSFYFWLAHIHNLAARLTSQDHLSRGYSTISPPVISFGADLSALISTSFGASQGGPKAIRN
jgi:hypothetical protein